MKRKSRKTSQRSTALSTTLLGLVTVFALGTGTGLLLAPDRAPSELGLSNPNVHDDFPLASEHLTDQVTAKLTFTMSNETPLNMAYQGKVTKTSCAPGQVVKSGTSPITVNSTALLALHTSLPLWRDLGPGSKGEDVTSLQKELVRLGYDITADGTYGNGTRNAVRDLQQKVLGIDKPNGYVTVDSLIWLPNRSITILSCDHQVGSAATEKFATAQGTMESAKFTPDSPPAISGPRVVALQSNPEIFTAVEPGTPITDREFLAAIAEDPAYLNTKDIDGFDYSVDYQLAESVTVSSVPPGALFELVGDKGCIIADGQPQKVTVVSSGFGRSYVTFDSGTLPAQVSITSQESTASCS